METNTARRRLFTPPQKGVLNIMDASTQSDNPPPQDSIIGLNVGGRIYQTYSSTIINGPNSIIKNAIVLGGDTDNQGNYFFDRDGKTFRHILEFIRNGEIVIPDKPDKVYRICVEASYFKISELLQFLNCNHEQ